MIWPLTTVALVLLHAAKRIHLSKRHWQDQGNFSRSIHHTIERDKKQGGCKAEGPEGPRFRNKQKSVVLTNQHSKFGIVVLDNVVELFRLMQHTRGQSPCISVVPEASNEDTLWPAVSSFLVSNGSTNGAGCLRGLLRLIKNHFENIFGSPF